MAAPEPEYDVKSPIPIMSPSIKHPDDNDVRMYDPDDHCSASIRRSSIKNSRISQMEGSVIVYSPNMDVPTIVYSDLAAQDPPNENPPMYTPNGGLKPQRHSTNSSTTAHSPNGLGISQPGELKPEQNLMVPRSPEISQVAPRSPSIRSYHSPRLTASIKSSAIAPVLEEKEGFEEEMQQQEEEERFIAFQKRPWFNPFYLALVCCTAMSLAIVFMIIYDLVYLGMGEDIFG